MRRHEPAAPGGRAHRAAGRRRRAALPLGAAGAPARRPAAAPVCPGARHCLHMRGGTDAAAAVGRQTHLLHRAYMRTSKDGPARPLPALLCAAELSCTQPPYNAVAPPGAAVAKARTCGSSDVCGGAADAGDRARSDAGRHARHCSALLCADLWIFTHYMLQAVLGWLLCVCYNGNV